MFHNHQGGREKNFEHSEAYKDKIRDYFEARGYDLIGDSKDDNTTVDQIFRKTYEYGNTDIWVEGKYTDLSRTNKEFLREFALYFIDFHQWSGSEPFELHLYIRNLKASDKWRQIFDIQKQDDDRVATFYERTRDNDELSKDDQETFAKYSLEDFKEFVSTHTTVHQANYDVLSMEVDRLEKSHRYEFDERFTSEQPPLNMSEQLEPNFAEISDPPDNLYVGNVDVPNYNAQAVKLLLSRTEPFWFEANKVHSLLPPEEFPDVVKQVTEMDTVSASDFDAWAAKPENETAAISLLQREICRQCIEEHYPEGATAVKYRGNYYLLFEHPTIEVPERTVRDQLVSKAYTEGSSPFVRHRSAQLDIFRFNDDYFMSVLVKNLFSKTGEKSTLLRGDRNSALHHRFNQNQYVNSQAFSEYRHWRRILNIHNREKDTTGQDIGFRKITELSISKRPPEDKNEIDSRDPSMQQQQLTDIHD